MKFFSQTGACFILNFHVKLICLEACKHRGPGWSWPPAVSARPLGFWTSAGWGSWLCRRASRHDPLGASSSLGLGLGEQGEAQVPLSGLALCARWGRLLRAPQGATGGRLQEAAHMAVSGRVQVHIFPEGQPQAHRLPPVAALRGKWCWPLWACLCWSSVAVDAAFAVTAAPWRKFW